MTTYKILKKFGHYEFNPKNLSHKIKWYEVDEIIEEKLFNRFSKATQAYCKRIPKPRKKPSNK